jgi:hypothetical protein
MLIKWSVMAARRVKKWLISLAGLTAGLAVLILVLWYTVLPPILEKRIRASLRDAGFPEASIEIENIAWSSATLRDLLLGPQYGFRVDEIRVLYSLASLRRSSVHGILLDGLEIGIAVRDTIVDIGPLANLRLGGDRGEPSRDGAALPFERVELRNARVKLDWGGGELGIPLEAVVRRIEADSVVASVHASIDGAPVSMESAFNIATMCGEGDVKIDKLSSELLEEIAKPFLAGRQLACTGRLNLNGNVTSHSGDWKADLAIAGEDLRIETKPDSAGHSLVWSDLETELTYRHPDSAAFQMSASINGIPFSAHGSIEPRPLAGVCRFQCDDVTAKQLGGLIAPYVKEVPFGLTGGIALEGEAAVQGSKLAGDVTIDGKNLTMQVTTPNGRMILSEPLLHAGIRLTYDGGHGHDISADVKLRRMSAIDTVFGLSVEEIAFDVPFSLKDRLIDKGTFTIRNVRRDRLNIPSITGSVSLSRDSAWIDFGGRFLPEAALEASGRIAWATDAPSAQLLLRIPTFTLENTSLLTELHPTLEGCEVGGTFSADAHIKYENGEVVPWITINVTDAFWRKPEADASIGGIAGTLTLDQIAPAATAGAQRMQWSNMSFGTFHATDGALDFRLDGDDSTLVASVTSKWIGGRIWSDGITVVPQRSMMNCDLHVEALSLQGILDFIKYEGVKGDGKIDGHLPVKITWGEHTRIEFGEGMLEANPRNGRLQLSKKTAMMFLGLTRDIDPNTVEQHDMAKLLSLRALQDMEYTLLELDFTDYEKRGWVTRIQIQGHGPYGDEANRIPIGGIDIEINNLDDLINTVILPGYQSRKFKLGGS